MAEREVVLRIGVNEKDLLRGTAASRAAMQSLGADINRSGAAMQEAFRGMPKGNVLGILTSQLSVLTYEMSGASAGGRVLAQSLGVLQRVAMGLGTGVLPLAGIMAAATAAMYLFKSMTVEASRTIDEYKKKISEARDEQAKLNRDLDDHARGVARYNLAWFSLLGSIDLVTAAYAFFWPLAQKTTLAQDYITKSFNDFTTAVNAYKRDQRLLAEEQKKEIELLKLQGEVIESNTKPNLLALIRLYDRRIEQIKSFVGPLEIKYHRELNDLLSARAGILKALEPKGSPVKDSPKVITEKPYDIDEAYRETQMWWGDKMIKDQEEAEARKVRAHEDAINDMRAADARYRASFQGYASQIGDAFAGEIMGISGSWNAMIDNMVSKLLSSGLTAAIMSIFTGGGFWAGFKGLMGFQHGTPFVPETGPYVLHKGEAVIPASQNIRQEYNYGGASTVYNVFSIDVEELTRRSIIPIIERASRNRKTRILSI